ncbi:MAG: hypothetical protein FD118_3704 [Rhodocyclaceae bacterium]|nr:MAG: hypothetical protein FD118_3704 [Rhodocyclaceae bacterium]
MLGGRRIGGVEAGLVEDELGVGSARRDPFGGQIATVGTQALLGGVLRVELGVGAEIFATAAERNLEAGLDGRGEFDHLAGDVLDRIGDAGAGGGGGDLAVVLPIAHGRVGVGGGGGGMGDAGGGHDAGRLAGGGGLLKDGRQRVGGNHGRRAFAARRQVIDRQLAFASLVAGDHGGHGRRRVGGLLVPGIGLGEGEVREVLEGEAVFFAGHALHLAVQDAGGGNGGYTHAVTDEEDDVLGLVRVGMHTLAVGDELLPVVEPVLDGFRALHDRRVGERGRYGAGGKSRGYRGGNQLANELMHFSSFLIC